ncbi:hypothetical protein [Candidatus Parabeggiatoa sp. HSG14]|uniref:hypothetical protein n=1 Tax=Candidatus Parabeggiatoa sp. HSG14 TaxID=3055593 RepID=UPI0025A8EE3A|nr:hypothetical protein [Thiotrichales bacterium HSG14]
MHKIILVLAIVTTLFFKASIVQADATFENANDSTEGGLVLEVGDYKPNNDFKFTLKKVVRMPSSDNGGLTYASELFNNSHGNRILPSGEKHAAAIYTIDGQIRSYFVLSYSLSDETMFSGIPMIGINSTNWLYPISPLKGGNDASSVSFAIDATSTPLVTGDQILLLYKIKNALKLNLPGEQITMKADLRKFLSAGGSRIHPSLTITIAQSKPALETIIKPISAGIAQISMLLDEKRFNGMLAIPEIFSPYLNPSMVQIGTLDIISPNVPVSSTNQVPNGVLTSDAEILFKIGNGHTETTLKEATLVVENGQFSASQFSSGRVFLHLKNAHKTINASVVENEKAIWELNEKQLADIISEPASGTTIRFEVNGKKKINLPAIPPKATLTITFNDSFNRTVQVSALLRQILQDGMTCWAYNIPNSTSRDVMALRITNDSRVSGKLIGTLYDTDGEELFVSQPLLNGRKIQPNQTVRIGAEDLEKIGATWEGRAVLKIVSTLPRIEMMLLQRQRGIASSSISNLSRGASGISCSN